MSKANMSFREQMRGFPYGQIFVVCVIRISEPIAFSLLFPYVYFLTRDFHVAKTEAEILTYSGYLSAAFSLAQVISAIQWSKFSQRRGRKLPLMIGLCGSAFSMLLLGFSKSYGMALLSRFLMGLLNGNLPILRTLLGELVTKKEQQPLAFSTFPLLWNFGCIVGPLLASALVHPNYDDDYYQPKAQNSKKDMYEDFLTRLFPWLYPLNETYPYALANIVVALLLLSSVVVVFFFLEETHHKVKYQYDAGLEAGDRFLRLLGIRDHTAKRLWITDTVLNDTPPQPFDYDDLLDTDSFVLESSGPLYGSTDNETSRKPLKKAVVGPFTRRESVSLVRTVSAVEAREVDETSIPWRALRDPLCYAPILANIILNLYDICFAQFVPVFMSNDVALDKNGDLDLKFPFRISGGFGYLTEQVGRMLSLTGFCGMLVILIVYPWVDRHYPLTRSFSLLHFPLMIVLILFPYAVFFLPENFRHYEPHEEKDYFLTNLVLYGLNFVKVFCTAMMFPLLQYLTHAGLPPKHRAIINSLSITASLLAKCFAPIMGGLLMTFSISHNVGYLFFWTLAAACLGGYFQSFQLIEDAEEV